METSKFTQRSHSGSSYIDSDKFSVEGHLTLITPEQAQMFVNFASSILNEDMHIMRAKITSCTPLPLNYLEEEEIQQRFSPTRIAKLIEKVCKITEIT